MGVWKHTPLDAVMAALSVAQLAVTLLLAASWEQAPLALRAAGGGLLVAMTVYNVIIVSHLFTHAPWFHAPLLNGLASALNSVNIGQSVQAYQLTHVRNHHRYNNDRRGPDGLTRDRSSTFQDGVNGEPASLFRYAFVGAFSTLLDNARALLTVTRLWRVGAGDANLLALAARTPAKRAEELRQVQLDRAAYFAALCVFAALSWRWTLFCYLPALYLALALVNLQNYYEHFGASPDSRYTDSVSHYGRLYNLLAFNDGYHQEHHLRPQTHWSRMREVYREHRARLDAAERIVSPVPAMFGFLHRGRPLLHRRRSAPAAPVPPAPRAASELREPSARPV